MGSKPVATKDDTVIGQDIHVVLVPSPGGPVPTPTPLPFSGKIVDSLSPSVYADNEAVAVIGSVANNQPEHIAPNGQFQKPPTNRGTIIEGSVSVFANNKALARSDDSAKCCNDPADSVTGHIIAQGTVYSG